MSIAHSLWAVGFGVLLLNLPFGYWRAGVGKFTVPWFLAVHAPVPLVVSLRILSGLGWHLKVFPVLAGAFFTGQYLGGKLRHWWNRRPCPERRPHKGP